MKKGERESKIKDGMTGRREERRQSIIALKRM